jgi:hypothetical protein
MVNNACAGTAATDMANRHADVTPHSRNDRAAACEPHATTLTLLTASRARLSWSHAAPGCHHSIGLFRMLRNTTQARSQEPTAQPAR